MDDFDKKVDEIRKCLERYGRHSLSFMGKPINGMQTWKCEHCPYTTKSSTRPE